MARMTRVRQCVYRGSAVFASFVLFVSFGGSCRPWPASSKPKSFYGARRTQSLERLKPCAAGHGVLGLIDGASEVVVVAADVNRGGGVENDGRARATGDSSGENALDDARISLWLGAPELARIARGQPERRRIDAPLTDTAVAHLEHARGP